MPLKMFQENKTTQIKHVIAIAAGKGGVGKSSVTVNLGLALQRLGYSVGILDADVYGPSIKKMLPPDLLPGMKADKIIPAISMGLKVVSMAFFRSDNESSAVRAPIANSLIQQFLNGVVWGNLDFLLIDFPPGTGDVQLTLSQKGRLSAALIVTTPQDIALLDVRKAIHFFNQVKVPLLGIVENMSYYQAEGGNKVFLFGKNGGKTLANENGVPLLGEIPLDPLIGACHDKGTSLFSQANSETCASIFIEIAENTIRHLATLMQQSNEVVEDFELIWKEMV